MDRTSVFVTTPEGSASASDGRAHKSVRSVLFMA